jgi:hypothetical protein
MNNLVKAALVGVAVFFCASKLQTPQAPAPVVPDGGLSDLIPKEFHPGVGSFYRGFSVVVADGGCETLGDFREAQQIAVSVYKKAGKLPDMSPLNAPVDAALKTAVGLDDVALDAQKRKALSDVLAVIAVDFGG